MSSLAGKIIFDERGTAIGAVWEQEGGEGSFTPYRAKAFEAGTTSQPCESYVEAVQSLEDGLHARP